jgi:hypothetical protein
MSSGQYSVFQLDAHGVYKKVGGWIDGKSIELEVEEIRSGLRVGDFGFLKYHPGI